MTQQILLSNLLHDKNQMTKIGWFFTALILHQLIKLELEFVSDFAEKISQ